MSKPARFPSAAEAKKAGWFSRRHETAEAHYAEQERRRIEQDLKKEREEASK